MSRCPHRNILVIIESAQRIRCRHCHLTIKAEELADGYCPECYDNEGLKRYAFEIVGSHDDDRVHYRCEDCGAQLKS